MLIKETKPVLIPRINGIENFQYRKIGIGKSSSVKVNKVIAILHFSRRRKENVFQMVRFFLTVNKLPQNFTILRAPIELANLNWLQFNVATIERSGI